MRKLCAVLMVAGVVSCNGTYDGPDGVAGNPPPPPPDSLAVQADIAMRDSTFVPSVDTVLVGRTVTWQNFDSTAHSVTSAPESRDQFDSGALPFGARFQHVFAAPGTYNYYDRFSGTATTGMRGTVVVQ